ncbi:hypothetical protein CPter91_2277 [Collimonas pratensis]|uniref:Uncharacterized protein n=1 Tax=Collimonas pratensis TaxID=279113 RepID=A0A127Q3I0_9BURK|nr:hypothetical protein CPter91_2277 [Collimonas pratensis]
MRIAADFQFDLLRTIRAHDFNRGGVKLLANFYWHKIIWMKITGKMWRPIAWNRDAKIGGNASRIIGGKIF